MKRAAGALVCLLLVSSAPFAAGVRSVEAQSDAGVRVRTARFWRGQDSTLVEALIGVPIRATDDPAALHPQVSLVVRDSTGQVLHREEWTDTLSARLATLARSRSGAEVTTPVAVLLAKGRYSVTVNLKQGARADSTRVDVVGFAQRPLLSDVLVSSRIRALASGEEPTGAETRKGRYAIERATVPKILPTDPKLWYYLELYPTGGGPAAAELEFMVRRASGGDPLFRTQRPLTVGERGGVNAAALVVQGLPPGEYRLIVTVRTGDRAETRESAFAMGSLQDAPVVASATTGMSESALLERYFSAAQTDKVIGQIIEALTVVPIGESVPSATAQLPADAQRRFLARYWSRIPDPKPDTPEHEMLEEYMSRVQTVSRDYVERDIGRSAVRTDRGRIFLKYGPPDTKQSLPMSGNRAVEVWKYTRQRNLKFAYLDETGFQSFKLVYTTDPNELTLADWQDRVQDIDTIRLILSF